MIPEFWGISSVGWQAVTAFISAATLLVAGAAALVALRQFKSNQATRDDQSRPYLVADFEPSPAGMRLSDLVVKNIGTTPARNVEVRLDPEPKRASEVAGYPLSESRLVSGTLPMVAPGRELRVFFDSMPERYNSDLPMSYTVTIKYQNTRGKHMNDKPFAIDMDTARGSAQATTYGMHDAAKALRGVDEQLTAIADHLRNPIQVTTEDQNSYDQRIAANEAEMLRQHQESWAQIRETRAEGSSDVES
jgi:hypothetical protein